MGFYRKKPVVIEAHRWRYRALDTFEIAEWCGGKIIEQTEGKQSGDARTFVLEIPTLEGTMSATNGDWIIEGVQGEFYPCKDDIFRQTYEVE